jgi:Zinc finger, C3HC4 type (RING finger)
MAAYSYYKFRSMEEAIHIICFDNDNNTYHHQFLSNHGKKCEICNDTLERHCLNTIETDNNKKNTKLDAIQIQLNFPEEVVKEFENPNLCPICYERTLDEVIMSNCGHEFCKICTSNYLSHSIMDGKV